MAGQIAGFDSRFLSLFLRYGAGALKAMIARSMVAQIDLFVAEYI
jgi:hypothetical protein